ncbi:DUF4290 domain-containing protein [Fulvivirgaceae bacterium PWU4]|uniref:DUF4290 domain-containing protein n=1 Tax=Chryseosolibacter histidini TaxID=2782349 RepID=A0AAP2GR66_9BACT|nr:DUF4290 domain-containing protein [Chryseosolibacter histidini]MBT1700853.1 DUF4290 domain-containing protein [Chryseosolibacter histidini]
MIGEYNTQRPHIILKEYGRNVQKLVEYIRNNPSKEKRTELAYTLIELIKQLTPTVKEQPENPQRVWDDLYIIADFNLDVNNPFPTPEREILFKKPLKVDYPQSQVRFKHYGKNIEKLVKEALKKEDPQEREDAIIYLGKLMKTFYGNWNKETIDDSVILKDIQEMSGGALNMTIEKVREDNLFEKLYKERKKLKPTGGSSNEGNDRRRQGQGGGGGHRQFNKGGGHKGNNFRRRRDQ